MRTASVLTIIKQILKSRKISYAELARELGLSESGLKKNLRAKDLSLERLSAIAEALGLTAVDILNLSQEERIQEVTLTEKQERRLLENPLWLRVYWRLAIENQTHAEILASERLGERELNSALRQLEKIDLLNVRDDGTVRLRHRGLYRWSEQGPLVRELNRRWSQGLLERSLGAKARGEPALHRLISMHLSDEQQEDFERGLHVLLDETLRKSRRERSRPGKGKARAYSLLVAALPITLIDVAKDVSS